jgi:hypothetical protein
MQHDTVTAISRLRKEFAPLRGLWPGVEADLQRMGFSKLADLRGRDPVALAVDYCKLIGRPFDQMLKYCFAAIVRFAETGEAVPWWHILRTQKIPDHTEGSHPANA